MGTNAAWREHRKGMPCVIEGCEADSTAARGMCPAHYYRCRRGAEVNVPVVRRSPRVGLCVVEACERPVYAVGQCRMHRARTLRTGAPGPARPLKGRRGSGTTDSSGYRYVTRADGSRTAEHRFVMERDLGRPLFRWENIHHRNGVRSDNRLANLELWVKPQLAGQRVQDLVDWLVATYPEEVRQALASHTP